MKLGPVTKLNKKNKITSTKFDNDVMPENCDVIVICSIYGQFGVKVLFLPKNTDFLQKNADLSKIKGA